VPKPYVVQKITTHGGATVRNTRPGNLGRAIKPETAATLTQMMVGVVQSGTGTAAAIPGVQVAGKTGTAETPNGSPHGWFVGFAPAEDPQVAVAVIIENAGQGGVDAAPLGGQVMRAVLGK